jgi:hypothetical protein
VTTFVFRQIEVSQIVPDTIEGPMGATGSWKWTAMVNGAVVRGTSKEDIRRRIGSALDSDSQTETDSARGGSV